MNLKRLLISIPKFIELNNKLVLGSHPGLRPNMYFFLGVKCLVRSQIEEFHFSYSFKKKLEVLQNFQIFSTYLTC